MATYKCYDDLKHESLEEYDKVYFYFNGKELNYEVRSRFLSSRDGDNSKIFDLLKINKQEFTSKAMGYQCDDGQWPEYKPHDYLAATKVVLELYKLIENIKDFEQENLKVDFEELRRRI